MYLNRAMIIGNLTRDPEVRTTAGGQTVATFGVATNHVWNDSSGQRQEKAEFHNIVAWGKLAEICGQYLTKGRKVYVEGRLQTREWQAQDGQKRNRTEIVAESMIMLDRGQGQQQGGYNRQAAQSAAPASAPAMAMAQGEQLPVKNVEAADEIRVEDIPF